MDHFGYRQDRLYAEEVPLSAIAERVGTPCYVYSHATLERHYRVFDEAFGDWPHHICFAVKANGNLAVLQVLERLGAGFDIVSGGELARVLAAGGRASNVVFSGVGKSSDEIAKALTAGVQILSIESGEELERVNAVALSLGHKAPIGIRINPDVDPNTHPYTPPVFERTSSGCRQRTRQNFTEKPVRWRGLRSSGSAATSARS